MNPITMIYRAVIAKITPLFSKLRMWFSWTFISNKLNMAVRSTTAEVFKVRPRSEDDYYKLFGWKIAKKLVIAGSIALIVMCCAYMVAVMPAKNVKKGVKNYKYNSIVLKYMKSGKVGILGKSGYLAYVGDIVDGTVTGFGKLYSPEGTLVYSGEFANGEYNGKGKRYYADGSLKYDGTFVSNYFDGEGTFYRSDGTRLYSGSFVSDMKDGEGKLFDTAGNEIFHGEFSKDNIVYKQFLGKNSSELSEYYKGKSELYTYNDGFIKTMPGIEAVVSGASGEDTLEGKAGIDGIYILKDSFCFNDKSDIKDLSAVTKILGKPIYQGNTNLTAQEAIALTYAEGASLELRKSVELKKSDVLKDASMITGYTASLPVYIYVYESEDCTYTFYTQNNQNDFFMYLIKQKQ
ncbi:MAG: hypothetical protein K6G84_07115 [Lachnospiraceae bacterium]|nr:hypothetical protein [Lachnospiraceae bacterium]